MNQSRRQVLKAGVAAAVGVVLPGTAALTFNYDPADEMPSFHYIIGSTRIWLNRGSQWEEYTEQFRDVSKKQLAAMMQEAIKNTKFKPLIEE